MEQVREIDEELTKVLRDGEVREEEGWITVDASGGAVGWVFLAWDETSNDAEERTGFVCQEGVGAFEDIVDGVVLVPSGPPAFDDAGIVTVYEDMLFRVDNVSKG
jgi:hypothetical protein